MVFNWEISGCVHKGPVYVAGTPFRVDAEWLRVGIRNTGAGSIDEVRVQALSMKPDTLGTLPIQLHRKDDNPPPGQPYEQFTRVPASKSPVIFIDVVSHIRTAPVFQLLHNMQDVEPWFPVGNYELTLIITGEGVKPVERTFSLGLVNDRLRFVRLR